MAMYYQGGSEIQADGLHTLYLMNPNYGGYSDHPTNMLLLNSAGATSAHALNPALVPHQLTSLPHTPQQAVNNPMAHDPNRPSSVISPQQQIQGPAFTTPRFVYNSWVDHPNVSHQASQGLSLSLSTNQTGFNKLVNGDQDFLVQTLPKTWSSSSDGVDSTLQSVIMGSKYLKAAQELLDEVANVGKSIIKADDKTGQGGSKDKARIIKETDTGNNTGASSGGGELTTAQKQEIQMKKSKLINMLDEVEQRYRHYNVQMQIIVASFEQAAGIGSVQSYTHLALKTISKQFRCLKDAITSQIKALGDEEDNIDQGSKLKYVDNQLRQHRSLQQLGMVQNNAWRPQRGLPETAVSVLRAWLFEHFLHPYPKHSDKHMLAKQTGLTRSQVSNWFINARVRLWKPMVEEMYLEEMKTQQQNNNTTNTSNSTNPNPTDHISASTVSTTPTGNSSLHTGPMSLAQLISPIRTENLSKKPRHDQDDSTNSILSIEMEMKSAETNTRGQYGTPYNTFQELNRFNPGQMANLFHGNNAPNSVSLTLGLPPSGNSPGAHHQQNHNFLNFGTTTEAGLDDIGYDQMLGFQNRKPYPSQLLHSDFVV